MAAALVAAHAWVAVATRHAYSDYTQDYLSARHLMRGGSMYDPLPPSDGTPEFTGGSENDHPPLYVLALAPLALLPYNLAAVALGWMGLAAGVAAAWVVGREVFGNPLWAVVLLLLHPGVAECTWSGNVSLILLLVVVVAWRAFRRQADVSGGVLLAVLAAWKLYPALLAVGLVLARRWRAAVTTCVGGGVILGAQLAVVGWGDHVRFVTERVPANSAEFTGHGFNLSLPGLAHRLFGPPCDASPWHGRLCVSPTTARVLAGGLQLLILVTAGMRVRRHPTPDDLFAVLVPAMLLICPLTWSHALPMLMITVALLATEAGGGVRRVALIGSTLALYLPGRYSVEGLLSLFGEVNWAGGLLLCLPTAGVLGLFGLAVTRGGGPDGAAAQERGFGGTT
jgi:hypothetical protein